MPLVLTGLGEKAPPTFLQSPFSHGQDTTRLPGAISSPGFDLTKVQDLSLDLIKFHEVPVGLKVPLDDIPLPSCTPQPSCILRVAEGPLDPTLHTTDENTK